MKKLLLGLCLLVGLIANAQIVVEKSDTIFVDETWSADSVKVTGNFVINDGVTLTINPGTVVEVQGQYYIKVDGLLLAQGTPTEQILFTASDKTLTASSGGWAALIFKMSTILADSSIIAHCIIEYGNAYGVSNTWTGGLYVTSGSKLKVYNSTFQYCQSKNGSTAIRLKANLDVFDNNLIVNNGGHGIVVESCSANLTNNTIVDNGDRGIYAYYSNPVIVNCISANNSTGNIYSYNSSPSILYSNIVGAGYSTNGNIDEDPLFVGTGSNPYALTSTSPCINAGDASNTMANLTIDTDFSGDARIYEGGTHSVIDMGAYELQANKDPYLRLGELDDLYYAKTNEAFELELPIQYYPSVSFNWINQPTGMTIRNDSIFWTPALSELGKTSSIEFEVVNGALKETISFEVHVLNDKEYVELPNSDILWDADTIKVLNNLTVYTTKTLTIAAGTVVEFQGNYGITLYGSLFANGTSDKPITFTAKDTVLTDVSGGWSQIYVNPHSGSNDSTAFVHCVFEYANNTSNSYDGVIRNYSNNQTLISNCHFTNCNNKNYYRGIINCQYGSAYLINNLIEGNTGSGISFEYGSFPIMLNNTIVNNTGYGIYGPSSLTDTIIIANSIFYNNVRGNTTTSIKHLIYNSFLDNYTENENENIGGEPNFIDTDKTPFALKAESKCVNSGIASWTLDSCFIKEDILGNRRIYDAATENRIDMGAYEYQGDPKAFLTTDSIIKQYARADSTFVLPLSIQSFPRNISYTVLSDTKADSIINDTLYWKPAKSLIGVNNSISIEVDNGVLKDTLNFDTYILDYNEYAELTASDTLWASDTIKVMADLELKDGDKLSINPGTFVEFQGNYLFEVNGQLLAQGTPSQQIVFTAKDTILTDSSGGWNGFVFQDEPTLTTDSSVISHCLIEYGNGYINGNSWCGGLHVRSHPLLQVYNSVFTNCRSKDGSTAVRLKVGLTVFRNNLIVNNGGDGIVIERCHPVLINNTIADNSGYGIYAFHANPIIINTISVNNKLGNLREYGASPDISYSNFGGSGLTTEGNIDLDPQFVEKGENPYALAEISACINSGKEDWTIDSCLAKVDMLGNARIYNGLTENRIDMGAFEYQGEPAPYLQFATDIANFDSLPINGEHRINILVTNNGPDNIVANITNRATLAGYYAVFLDGTIIKSNTTTTLAIVFSPTSIKDYSNYIVIKSSDERGGADTIYVNGRGVAEPKFTINATSVNRLVTCYDSLPSTVLIKNTGEGYLSYDIPQNKILNFDAKLSDWDVVGHWKVKEDSINGNQLYIENTESKYSYSEAQYLTLKDAFVVHDNSNMQVQAKIVDSVNSVRYKIEFEYQVNKGSWKSRSPSSNSENLYYYLSNYVTNGDSVRFRFMTYGYDSTSFSDFVIKEVIIRNGNDKFTVSPTTGIIEPGASQEIEITIPDLCYAYDSVPLLIKTNAPSRIVDTIYYSRTNTYDYMSAFGGANRAGAVSFSFDSIAFVGLGKNDYKCFNDFWYFKLHSEMWVQAPDFPGEARADAEAFVIDDKAYVGLGYNPYTGIDYKDFYCFNPVDTSWTKVADFGGEARSEAISFAIDSIGYVGTGANHENGYAKNEFGDFWKFNPNANVWTLMGDSVVTPRRSAQGFALMNKGYISGGVGESDMQEYDPTTNAWTQRVFADGLNLSLSGASVIADGNYAYILYGTKDQVSIFYPDSTEFNCIKNIGDELNLESERIGGVGFMLDGQAIFGLGLSYGNLDASIYSNELIGTKLRFTYYYPPTDITLSSNSIFENTDEAMVGILSTTDATFNDEFTYYIVEGDESLYINGDTLYAYAQNYEEEDSVFVTLQSTDSDGLSLSKKFVIVVEDVNEAPTYFYYSNDSVNYYSPIGKLVSEFDIVDEDINDEHIITFDSDEDYNEDTIHYNIVDNKLVLASKFEVFEDIHSLTLKVTDEGGLAMSGNIWIYMFEGVGIQLVAKAENVFQIFPNPAESMLTIESLHNELIQELVMFSTSGAQVVTKQVNQLSLEQLDVSLYESGIYYLLIKTPDHQYMQKVIIE